MTKEYTVRQGDCINSIAVRFGFFPITLWDHPANGKLKSLRKDPNILQPGDIVNIPELTSREVAGATEQRHHFKRKGVPAELRLAFYRPKKNADTAKPAGGGSTGSNDSESVYEDPATKEPKAPEMELVANAPYVLKVDGKLSNGQSDGEGRVKLPISPNARKATILFFSGTDDEISYDLNLGEMDSIDTIIGARKRLRNLGFCCSPEGNEMDPDLKDALMRFQQENGLETSGALNQGTKDKLLALHGS